MPVDRVYDNRMRSRSLLLVAFIFLISVAASGCSGSATAPSETTQPKPTATTVVADSLGTQEFENALEAWREFTREWNSVNLVWLTAYTDDSISIDEYLRITYETEQKQRRLIFDLVLDSNQFPTVLQDATGILLENCRGRADAFHAIVEAEVAADDEAWRAAADEYYSFSGPEAATLVVTDMFSVPEIDAAFAEAGIDTKDILEALAAAYGGG